MGDSDSVTPNQRARHSWHHIPEELLVHILEWSISTWTEFTHLRTTCKQVQALLQHHIPAFAVSPALSTADGGIPQCARLLPRLKKIVLKRLSTPHNALELLAMHLPHIEKLQVHLAVGVDLETHHAVNLPHLASLSLPCTHDAQVTSLPSSARLHTLEVCNSRTLTLRAVQHMTQWPLVRLDLAYCTALPPQTIRELAHIPSLQHLDMTDCGTLQATDVMLLLQSTAMRRCTLPAVAMQQAHLFQHIADQAPDLEYLLIQKLLFDEHPNIRSAERRRQRDVSPLAKLQNLSYLSLQMAECSWDRFAVEMASPSSLTVLKIGSDLLTDEALAIILQKATQLQELACHMCNRLTTFPRVHQLQQLQRMSLACENLDPASIYKLRSNPNVQEVSLPYCNFYFYDLAAVVRAFPRASSIGLRWWQGGSCHRQTTRRRKLSWPDMTHVHYLDCSGHVVDRSPVLASALQRATGIKTLCLAGAHNVHVMLQLVVQLCMQLTCLDLSRAHPLHDRDVWQHISRLHTLQEILITPARRNLDLVHDAIQALCQHSLTTVHVPDRRLLPAVRTRLQALDVRVVY